MKPRQGRSIPLAVMLVLGACTSGAEAADAPAASSEAPSEPSPTRTVKDAMEIEYFAPLEPGTYSIDPDLDPSTPLRVEYDIPAEGWSRWIGALEGLG